MATGISDGSSIPAPSTNQTVKVKEGTNPFEQKEMFLKLLVAQLKNQDPTSPMDQKDMLGQMAQFSQLEQLTNLASTMSSMALTNSVALMGKTVDYTMADTQGNPVIVRGVTVEGISAKDGKVFLELSDGAKVEPGKLVAVH